jgi:hypothetical protein
MITRETVTEFAVRIRRSPYTVRKMCRNKILKGYRDGGGWMIDVEASEKALSLKYGNAAERDLARKNLR